MLLVDLCCLKNKASSDFGVGARANIGQFFFSDVEELLLSLGCPPPRFGIFNQGLEHICGAWY